LKTEKHPKFFDILNHKTTIQIFTAVQTCIIK